MHVSSVCKCNEFFDEETLHPLVSVVALDAPCGDECLCTDCYAVVLVTQVAGGGRYGRMECDYSDAVMFFMPPETVLGIVSERKGTMLLFHPDLIKRTSLGQSIRDCTFFHYKPNEALHLSACEERQMKICIDNIDDELHWGVDQFSKALLCNKIEMLLNYAMRFYCRQFILRHDINASYVKRINDLIDQYFISGKAIGGSLPTAKALAAELGMSESYINDMVKYETGVVVAEYVNQRRIFFAKRQLLATCKSEAEISDMLGFCSPACFNSIFKKITGCEPEVYRSK